MELFDYQVAGIAGLRYRKKCILADDMGLGKTAEVLLAVDDAKRMRVLVVCPSTAMTVWRDEIKLWLPNATYTIVNGSTPAETLQLIRNPTNFTIINYELTISRASKGYSDSTRLDVLTRIPWTAIIFDEAHRIKNRKAKSFAAANKIQLMAKPEYVIPVTATPILNKPEEIWTLLHMIDPIEFSSFWKFIYKYCHTKANWYNPHAIDIGDVMDPEKLKKDLAKYMIRRTKEEVWKDMPEKIYQTVSVRMVGKQREAYNTMLKQMYVRLTDGTIEAVNVVAQMTRLKQLTISLDLLDCYTFELRGAKIDALTDIVDGLGDQKAVIFSQYSTVIDRLKYDGLVKFTGDYNQLEREVAIDRFQNDSNVRLLATTTQCGGQSITLTAGTVVVFLDLLWTPKLNGQAADRLHRRGQTKTVNVINIFAEDSIESYINKVLQCKEDLFEAVIPQQTISKHLIDYIKEASSG